MSPWFVREILYEFRKALPIMAAAGIIYWFIRRHIDKKRFGSNFKEIRRSSRLNQIIGLLLIIWAAFLVSSTLLPWEWSFGSVPHWRFIPDVITDRHIDIRHSLSNVLVFIPIGLALPFMLKRPVFWQTVLVGFCFTFAIEFLQGFSTQRDGNIDDIICNTLGVIAGYILYLLIKLILPKFTAKCMIKSGG